MPISYDLCRYVSQFHVYLYLIEMLIYLAYCLDGFLMINEKVVVRGLFLALWNCEGSLTPLLSPCPRLASITVESRHISPQSGQQPYTAAVLFTHQLCLENVPSSEICHPRRWRKKDEERSHRRWWDVVVDRVLYHSYTCHLAQPRLHLQWSRVDVSL